MKVEAQPLEVDQGTSLADAWIHHLFECRLEQMGGRVIRLSATAAGLGPLDAVHHITHRQTDRVQPVPAMHEHIRGCG